jgi:PRC-barrel domain protein
MGHKGRWAASFSGLVLAAIAVAWFAAAGMAADEQKPPQQPPAEAPPPAAPAITTVVDPKRAIGVLGHAVKDASEEDMGRVVDVVVDPAGHVIAGVIDFGGFLGVGSRKIAVDWTALHFRPAPKDGNEIRLELTRDQLKAAPEYNPEKPLVVIGMLGALKPLNFDSPPTMEK